MKITLKRDLEIGEDGFGLILETETAEEAAKLMKFGMGRQSTAGYTWICISKNGQDCMITWIPGQKHQKSNEIIEKGSENG